MARDYARIMTAIWRNDEFRALDEASQRMYLLLVTQPDISAAGVLALRVRRWADMSSSSSADSLVELLKALEVGRFIVVDWDAEELLIRSFIRWDGGFNNPKRRPVIIRDAAEVVSSSITRHLATEFKRCGIPTDPDSPPPSPSRSDADSHVDSLSGGPSEINRVDLGDDPFPQVNSLSDSEPTNHGVVVTYSSKESTTHNPEKSPPATPSAQAPPTAQTLIAEWIEGCRRRPPGSVIGQASKVIKLMLEEGLDPEDVRNGIEVWAAKGLHPSALPSVVNELMNSNPSALIHANGRKSGTDENIRQMLAGTGTDGPTFIALPGGKP